jgi:CRP-like cAMP-binding protein
MFPLEGGRVNEKPLAERFREEALDARQRADLLDGGMWVDGMPFRDVELLARSMAAYRVPADAVLFREGDTERFMALVLGGEMRIVKADSAGRERVLAVVGPHRTLGEMALVDGWPRSASAVASKESRLLVLSQAGFERIADAYPKLWGTLLLKLARLMSQRLRQTSGVLVDHLGGTK